MITNMLGLDSRFKYGIGYLTEVDLNMILPLIEVPTESYWALVGNKGTCCTCLI